MLTEQQIREIREHLENAKNPIFLFDNDPDGLCSFILLRRYLGRGRGVVIKSLPGLDKSYFKKVEEFKADYIFVLDKPIIDQEFIDLAEKSGIPLVHIDHHNVPVTPIKYYYNTYYVDKKYDPVAYLCYKIANKKEDAWICAIGCITDAFLPDFTEDMKKQYPELIDYNYKNAFDILYNTQFGKISMILSFGLRDKTSSVISMIRALLDAKSPYDLLEENARNNSFLKRFEIINKKYQAILEKAKECVEGKIIFFTYSGDMSISQYVANELAYKYPDKIVVVGYTKSNIVNLSLRWKGDIRTAVVNAIQGIEGATGGGHEHASGARMLAEYVPKFRENLLKEIEKIEKEKS